jgi:hypothetical protein
MMARAVGKRLYRLEHSPAFASPRLMLTRIDEALQQASLRIIGKRHCPTDIDEATHAMIFKDISDRFIQHLTDEELDFLEAGLKEGLSPTELRALEERRNRILNYNLEKSEEW